MEHTKKRAPKATFAFGVYIFCTRHQMLRNNQIFIPLQDLGPRGTIFKKKSKNQ